MSTSRVSASAPLWKRYYEHGNVLTPGRYVGAEAQEDDGEPFEAKIARLTERLADQMAEARQQDEAIAESLKIVGFGDSS